MSESFESPEVHTNQPEREPQEPGKLLVITGPSGAGKDTLVNELLKIPEYGFDRIVTYAARQPRTDEVDGVDYHFISPGEFEEKKQAGFFAEYVDYGGGKGTPKEPFEEVLFSGRNYIWRIDPSRAAETDDFFRSSFPEDSEGLIANTQVFYVGTPRLTLLKDRFVAREGSDYDPSDLLERLTADWSVWGENKDKFPHVIINGGTVEDMTEEALRMINSVW